MIFVVCGANSYLRDSHVAKKVQSYQQAHGDMNFALLDGDTASYEAILEAATTLPFLADARMVVVKSFSACKQLIEQIEAFVAAAQSDDTDIILVDAKLDKRTSWYKYLTKHTTFQEFQPLDSHGVERWLVDEAGQRGGVLRPADARILVARVGEDQQLLSHELDKLLAYNPQINRATIELLCEPIPQSTIFMMVESLFAGDLQRALELYDDQRRQRVEPQAMLGMVVWQMHLVALAKTAGTKPAADIARQAGVSPFALQKAQTLARRLQIKDIKQLFGFLTQADLRSKSESIDVDRLMQTALMTIARTVAA